MADQDDGTATQMVPVFPGTHVPVTLFDHLENGGSLEGFLKISPGVTREDAIAVLERAKEALLVRKTYIFRVEIEQEEDGRWSAEVPTLSGCATWGYTREEALRSIREATELYIESLLAHGERVPTDAPKEIIEEPAVAVTV